MTVSLRLRSVHENSPFSSLPHHPNWLVTLTVPARNDGSLPFR